MSDKSLECHITLTADDRRTWFEVYDHNLSLVASGGGNLTLSLPTGLYEVHSERGSIRHIEILKLTPGSRVERHVRDHAGPVLLPIRSFLKPEEAPHAAAMIQATSAMRGWWLIGRRRARIVVMLRQPTGSGKTRPIAEQTKSISLLDPARRTVHKFTNRWAVDEVNGYAITRANVAPGCYTLRVADSIGISEQSVVAIPARQTIVVAPLFLDGPCPGLATIAMCHTRESWSLVPEEHLLWSESAFSRLRRGRLPMTEEEAASARKFFDTDPLLAIVAANSLAQDVATRSLTNDGGSDKEPSRAFPELLNALRRTSPQHPDVHMLLQVAGPPRKPVKYPPMFADTYAYTVAALHANGKSRSAVSEGSYAENACAAAFQGGIFLRWPAGTAASIGPSPAGAKTRIALSDSNLFTHSAVQSLFQRSTRQAITQWLVTVFLAMLTRIPIINRWLTGMMRIKAGWESRNIRRLAAEKVILYGQQVAALRRGSTALTLTRITDPALADGSGVPTPISARIRNHLVAHLGGEMTNQQIRPDATQTTPPKGSAADGSRPLPVLIAAIAVLVGFAVLVGWMLASAKTTNGTLWDRQLYIFTSVEAIVFAAAGALFGVEVKRQQVAGAERRADTAGDRAAEALRSEKSAATEAERARALAAATRGAIAASRAAGADGSQAADVPGARSPIAEGVTPNAALTALGNIADELFPPTPRQDLVDTATLGTDLVPSLIGKTEDEAAQILGRTSFSLIEDPGRPQDQGTMIITQNPAAYSNAPRGSSIVVTFGVSQSGAS